MPLFIHQVGGRQIGRQSRQTHSHDEPRETDSGTERQGRQADRHRDNHSDGQRNRLRHRQTGRQADRHTLRWPQGQTGAYTDGHT